YFRTLDILRHPHIYLFPYTTLFRSLKLNQFLFVHAGIEKRKDYKNSSLSSLLEMKYFYHQGHLLDDMVIVGHLPTSNYYPNQIRSEEHTSELQSRFDLVCRLLLEKK